MILQHASVREIFPAPPETVKKQKPKWWRKETCPYATHGFRTEEIEKVKVVLMTHH